jgi:hypothetical protein
MADLFTFTIDELSTTLITNPDWQAARELGTFSSNAIRECMRNKFGANRRAAFRTAQVQWWLILWVVSVHGKGMPLVL